MKLANIRKASPLVISCHGNGATFNSFSYIKKCLPQFEYFDLHYDSKDGFFNNLEYLQDCLMELVYRNPDEEFVFLSHSLGGIYSAYLASFFHKRTLGVITLATPWGGCEHAPLLNLIAPSQLFKDIKASSPVMRGVHKLRLLCPVTSVVTTSGQSSLWVKVNDSVVSRESMMALKGNVEYYEVCANHSEVLLHTDTVSVVEEAIEQAFQKSKASALINEKEAA